MRTRITLLALTLLAMITVLFVASAVVAGPSAQGPGPSGEVSLAGTVASKMSYQGRLTDPGGNPLNGSYNLVFQFWDDASAGSQVGGDIVKNGVAVSNGLFTVELDVPQSTFNGQGLWLRIQVGGQWLTPRQELLPVPYAFSLRPGARIDGSATGTALYTAVLNVKNSDTSAGRTAIHGVSGAEVGGYPGQEVGVQGEAATGYGVAGLSSDNAGVYGGSANAEGVWGSGDPGVYGYSTRGDGVLGRGVQSGVKGTSDDGHGVIGTTNAPAQADVAGVYGSSDNTPGVKGTSVNGPGGVFSSTLGLGAYVTTDKGYGLSVQSDENIGVFAHSGRWTHPIYWYGHMGMLGIAEEGVGVAGNGMIGGSFTGEQGVRASGTITGVTGTADAMDGRGVVGIADNYNSIGVSGQGMFGTGVSGFGEIGVKGTSTVGVGVRGEGPIGVEGISQIGAGVYGTSTGGDGVQGFSSDRNKSGVYGESANGYGVTGRNTQNTNPGVQGFGNTGVYGESSADYGQAVHGYGTGAYTKGVLGSSAYAHGVGGYSSGTNGSLAIGVYGQTNATWGLATNQRVYAGSGCTNCTVAFVGQNADAGPLEVGDVVAISGIAPPLQGQQTPILQVRRATAVGRGALGVVQARATVTATKTPVLSGDFAEMDTVEMPGLAQGRVAPGDYLFVVVQGLVQVRVDATLGAIQVGDPVGPSAVPGLGQSLSSTTPTAPVLGRALETLTKETGLIWVLVLGR